jgi:hypothetical protein
VNASAEANDCLALPSDGPRLVRKQWRAEPSLAPEFQLVLDRIKSLAAGGLTSMHVVGDFLKHRIASLQQRACLCRWFTGSNDISRVQRGPRTDLTWDELEVLVKGITGESFIPESLILPQGISALCDDPGLRTAILATLLTLDESGVAVRQTSGRDPHRGIRISDAPAGGPQSAGVAPSAPARASHASVVAPRPLDKGKGAASSSSALGGAGVSEEDRRRWLHRADGSFVSDPPLGPRRSAPRSVRGLMVGPRRLAPRPRARRCSSVLRHHNHRVRHHHNHHHRRVRCHHHHPGAISPRGTSNSNNNSSNSKSSGRHASRVVGRSRAPSECNPFFSSNLFIMSMSLHPSFACQGFLPLCSQGRASPAPGCCHRDSATGPPGSR